jgi:hypothetical protein
MLENINIYVKYLNKETYIFGQLVIHLFVPV